MLVQRKRNYESLVLDPNFIVNIDKIYLDKY